MIFGLTLISFFMTYFSARHLLGTMEISGMQMVIGLEANGAPADFPLAPKLAFGAAVAGFLFTFWFGRTAVLPAAAGIAGLISLLVLNVQLSSEAAAEGIRISFEGGFWLATFLFAGATIVNWWEARKRHDRATSR